jgi:ComEC/Rec2-related protein
MLKEIFSAASLNFWIFIAFSIGIVLGYHFTLFLLFFIVALALICSIYFLHKKQKFFLSDIFILILFLSLGALWQISHAHQKIYKYLDQENIFVLKVASLPQKHSSRNTFIAEVSGINNTPIALKAKVIDYTKKLNFLNSYRLGGKLIKKSYYNTDFYILWVKSMVEPKELPLSIIDKFTRKTVFHLLGIFKNNLSDESYRFLASVFLGRRELLGKQEKEVFTDAGISHLLAISGSNIGLTALILFFILRFFNIRFRPRLLFSIFFLIIYSFITGANPPTLRAMIMYSVFAFGFFVKRKINPFSCLGLAGLICLIMNPSWLFDVGYQLSFLSVFALILGFKIFNAKPLSILVLSYLRYLFLSSLFVTVFITPLVSYYFNRVYILSILNNIILIPFFTFILIINFLLIIFSPLRFIADSIGAILSLFIFFFYKLSQFLGSLKFSYIYYSFTPKAIFFYYFMLMVIIVFVYVRNAHVIRGKRL